MYKKREPEAKETSMGSAYVGLWAPLHEPKNNEILRELGGADAVFLRISVAVDKVNKAKESAEKDGDRNGIVRAETCSREVARLLCGIAETLEPKEIGMLGAREKVGELVAQVEEKAQGLLEKKELPAKKAEPERAEMRFAEGVDSLICRLREFAPGDAEGGPAIMSKRKITEAIMALSPSSLKIVDEALFGEKGYLNRVQEEPGIRRLMIAVACSVVDDLTQEGGKIDARQLKDALDYLLQKENENSYSFWGKIPAPCWAEAMRIADAVKRGKVSRDAEGRVWIAKG